MNVQWWLCDMHPNNCTSLANIPSMNHFIHKIDSSKHLFCFINSQKPPQMFISDIRETISKSSNPNQLYLVCISLWQHNKSKYAFSVLLLQIWWTEDDMCTTDWAKVKLLTTNMTSGYIMKAATNKHYHCRSRATAGWPEQPWMNLDICLEFTDSLMQTLC